MPVLILAYCYPDLIAIPQMFALSFICGFLFYTIHILFHATKIVTGYCSNTNSVHRIRWTGTNFNFNPMQPHYYRVQQMEFCHEFGEVARRSSWAIELLALWQNNSNNNRSQQFIFTFQTHTQSFIKKAKKEWFWGIFNGKSVNIMVVWPRLHQLFLDCMIKNWGCDKNYATMT